MPRFTDKAGREWRVEVDCAVALDWGSECGLDLDDWDKASEELGQALAARPLRAAGLLWVACREQARQQSPPVTEAEFLRALPAETDIWRGALHDAILLFVRGRRMGEEILRQNPHAESDSTSSSTSSRELSASTRAPAA